MTASGRATSDRATSPAHIFSVDVEDYFQVSAFESIVPVTSWDQYPSRVDRNTRRLLEMLGRHDATATFFTLGWVADRFPDLVRAIVDAGHEVASHSYWHRRVTTLTPDAFREDLRRSKDVLEQVSGRAVTGYRAPSFSIVPGVEWAWEILAEEGFHYDSSVFPIRRPGYGNPGRPREPYMQQAGKRQLQQFPLATVLFAGARLPAAGGGYLRLLPDGLMQAALRDAASRGVPAMCYVHPWEIDPEQPRLPVGALTRLRHYGGLGRVEERLNRLMASHRFTSVQKYLAAA